MPEDPRSISFEVHYFQGEDSPGATTNPTKTVSCVIPIPEGYVYSHSYPETWTPCPELYCPNCGERRVWAGSGWDYYVGCQYLCVACEAEFYLPDGVARDDSVQNRQRLHHLKNAPLPAGPDENAEDTLPWLRRGKCEGHRFLPRQQQILVVNYATAVKHGYDGAMQIEHPGCIKCLDCGTHYMPKAPEQQENPDE